MSFFAQDKKGKIPPKQNEYFPYVTPSFAPVLSTHATVSTPAVYACLLIICICSFFAEANRIAASNYLPSIGDVLRARTKTTAITEIRFPIGQLSIHMVDVGGQRSQRNKWIHCFESVTSIIFVTSLSEYDQVLLEERDQVRKWIQIAISPTDGSQNRMEESFVLFESVINSWWFSRTSIVLFLNKIDVFKNKLPKVRSPSTFPRFNLL